MRCEPVAFRKFDISNSMKVCSKCGESKELSCFSIRSESGRYRNECKKCVAIKTNIYYQNNKDKVKERVRRYEKAKQQKRAAERKQQEIKYILQRSRQTHKVCTKCKEEKFLCLNNFRLIETVKKYDIEIKRWFSVCKKCEYEYQKNRRDKLSPDIKRQRAVERWLKIKQNPEKLAKQYAATNARRKKQTETDPRYRMRRNISTIILNHLKRKNSSKRGQSIFKYLPYSFDELVKHIESQFKPWMNWENLGRYDSKAWNDDDMSTWKWQLDHIIPESLFNYVSMEDSNFVKCWSLSNLRPLSAKQNVLEGVHRIRHK